jgi:hypothetical protein
VPAGGEWILGALKARFDLVSFVSRNFAAPFDDEKSSMDFVNFGPKQRGETRRQEEPGERTT